MRRRGTGLFGPWSSIRKVELGLIAILLAFLFVVVLLPTGVAILLLLIGAAYVWFPATEADPTRGTYIYGTPSYRVAVFFQALRTRLRDVLNPVVSLGAGPPSPDPDHELEPGIFPPTRLSSFWCLLLAVPLAFLDHLMYSLHYPFWGEWKPHSLVLVAISLIGWYMTFEIISAVRRIQGSSDTIQSVEPRPAVMLNKIRAEIPYSRLIVRSFLVGVAPAILMFIIWAVADWPPIVLMIALPAILLSTAVVSASIMMQRAYVAGWQHRVQRREFWDGVFAYLKADTIPTLVKEIELPTFEEWLDETPEDEREENPYQPLVKVATFGFPSGVVYADYLTQIQRIDGQLASDTVAIAPIGQIDEEGREKLGTIGSIGFRVWYMEEESPSLLDPYMNKWVRELLCKVAVARISEVRGIGHCIMRTSRVVTRPESKRTIVKIDVVPQGSGVNAETFMNRISEIQNVLDVPWVRADRATNVRGSKGNIISLYIGQDPKQGEVLFSRPASVERKVIDRMNWSYYFNTRGLQGVTGLPRLISRTKTTEVVDKLVFRLPDGLSFDAVDGSLDTLKTTSGHEFMEIRLGDERDTEGLSEHQKIRAEADQDSKFTIIAGKKNPLKRVFNFQDYHSELITGREPGVAKMSWSPGMLSDDSLAIDDWAGGNDAPHMLLAGESGSGKSVVASSQIIQLALNNGPGELRFNMIEPKNELQVYRDLDVVDHFVDSWTPGSFLENCADLSERMVQEMEDRNKKFVSHPKSPKTLKKAREIAVRESEQQGTPLERHPLYLPYSFLIIEECASVFADALGKDEKEEQARLLWNTTELSRKARSSGIFLIILTQYPTNASVPSIIRNQMRRIGMRCRNVVASRVVIDESGLEDIRIPGAGMIRDGFDYRNFRGFWVQDGDPDYGEQNDIISALNSLPNKSGRSSSTTGTATATRSRVVAPDPTESVFYTWSQSATAKAIDRAVNEGKRTRDPRSTPKDEN